MNLALKRKPKKHKKRLMQRNSTGAEKEYHAMGINPQIAYVSKEDGEKWNQAVKEWHEIKKQMGHDR